MKKASKRKRLVLAILCGALTLAALLCFAATAWLGRLLTSQQEASRWKGESDLNFAQVSCYIPVDEKLGLDKIYAFRTAMVERLHQAAMDVDNTEQLWVDAWSANGKAVASTELGRGDAAVIAVGGAFFEFHPLRLFSGSYISEGDLMQDRVLLDEELAWLLFGSTDLQGLPLQVDGVNFVVAGVIEREQDFASQKAYSAGMGLYMSYEAYEALHESGSVGIDCYEFVMAEPVDGYALNFAREKFPVGDGEILQNTGRFSFDRMWSLMLQFGTRSMQKMGLMYPYWENAARCVEDWCALLTLLGLLFLVFPVVMLVLVTARAIRRGKEKLDDELIPELKDRAGEAVRVRQRRRWERKHGRHEA